MINWNCCRTWVCDRRCWIIGAAVLVWFVMYPDDLAAIVAPLKIVLGVSKALSLGFYVLAAVAVFSWAMYRTWSRREPG